MGEIFSAIVFEVVGAAKKLAAVMLLTDGGRTSRIRRDASVATL